MPITLNGTSGITTPNSVTELTPSTTTGSYYYWNNGSVNVAGLGGYSDSSTAGHLEFYTTTGSTLTEAMRIDSAGNMGLGVTPSAWSGSFKALEFSYASLSSSDSMSLSNNAYRGASGWVYKNTAPANLYQQNSSGNHIWSYAASGSAGSAISFTQAMTLNASGNLGLGTTTSPNYKLQIGANGNDPVIYLGDGNSSNYTGGIAVQGANDGSAGGLTAFGRSSVADYTTNYINMNYYYNGTVGFIMSGTSLAFCTGVTTRSSGYSGERARIEASGNLLVGTTSTSVTDVGWKFLPAVNGSGFVCNTTGDGPTISVTNINATIANGYRWFSFRINSGGTQAGSISYNTGTSQVNYNQTSDRRIKSNITPALPVLEKMKQVEVVSFDMGLGHTDYGVIAQDLHKLFPEAVSVGDDLDEPKTLWGFAGASLVPAMVKAIQELAAKVSALEAKQ